MGSFTSEFKVGLLTIVGALLLGFFALNTRDAPFKPGGAYTVYTIVPSAEGIQFGSIVSMAGVQVGRVGEVKLTPEGKARVNLEVQREVQLSTDSKAILKTMGILGDRSVHLVPGVTSTLIPPGGQVPFSVGAFDMDQLSQQLGGVATDIKAVTTDLKDISGSLKGTISEGTLTTSIENILKNLDTFTAAMSNVGQSNQADLGIIVDNIRDVSQNLKDIMGSSKNLVQGSEKQVNEQFASLRAATEKLDQALAGINQIVGRVEKGEGTVGALLNERQTVDSLNETIAGANEMLEKVNRFRTYVTYRGDYYVMNGPGFSGQFKNTLDITLASRKDYYYTLALVSDPVYDSTVRVIQTESRKYETRVFSDAYQFSFQFAKRWHDLALRLGIRENHGGVGADYYFLKDRIALTADLYDFSGSYPNLELRARAGFYNHLYVTAGVDDVINRATQGGVNLYVGGGFTFQDDDLKYLLSFIPIP